MAETRITLLKKIMREKHLSHILVSDPVQAAYISGFHATLIYLLVSARTCFLFTDFRYRQAAQRFCRTRSPWQFVEISKRDFSFLSPYLEKRDTVGVQSDSLTLDDYDLLNKNNRGVRFVKIQDAVSRISAAKLPGEIKSMRRAAAIGDKAYAAFIGKIKTGMTEIEAAKLLESLCAGLGSEKPSFDTIVLFGAHAALPHGRPSMRRLRDGDWVLCDFGCTVNGFASDMTRTAVKGRASAKMRSIYAIVRKAQSEAKKAIRPGVRANAVDAVARAIIDQAGFADSFGHGTGHGLGLLVHENPRLNKQDTTRLRENMVVTVEPGIYLPSNGGVRIEDMLAVTARGARSLTKTPRTLREI